MMSEGTLPARLEEIVEEFEESEGREKVELLLDYAQQMPELPAWVVAQRDQMESVPECMTPVHVLAETKDGAMHFYFDVPPESPTVRGFATILGAGLESASPHQVLAVPNDFFTRMGLEKVLTHQRLNGMSAILAHMKRLAGEALSTGQA